ncbi:hypothetical protein JCM33374_g417 [Metschnikowia sp. JCM 33374]|nr:hypothetical protein JCM33374_g417 [Metschnikowia sp. JCM 33374]
MDSSILSKHAASSATHDKKESVAVLDLKVSGKDIFCTLESGQLCGVPRVFTSSDPLSVSSNEQTHSLASGGDFLFAERFSLGPVSSRIRCDVLNGQDTVHLVAGSESGSISHYKYDQKSRQASLVQTESVAPPSTVISGVSWSPSGVYASSGDAISLIAFG